MPRKKTHEEFVKEVYDLIGDEYLVCEDIQYKNTHSNISFIHNICGQHFQKTPSHFLSGQRCPKCSNKLRKTPEQFNKEVFDLVGNEYTVLGDYENNRTLINMRHNSCGYEWNPNPKGFLRGNRCPKCSLIERTNKLSSNIKEFKHRLSTLVGEEYEICKGEKYKNANTHIKIIHNKCGHKWKVRPSMFLKGTRCPKCIRPNYNRNTISFKKEIYNLVQDEYSLSDGVEYESVHKKIKLRHNKCNHSWLVDPASFLQGSRCPKCARNMKKTHNDFVREIDELVGDEYVVIGEYKTSRNCVELKHNICGYIWDVNPNHFLNSGTRCPKCAIGISYPEKFVMAMLNQLKINYRKEKVFKWSKNVFSQKEILSGLKKYDFYIPDLNCIIETHGMQHYKETSRGRSLKFEQENDILKENLAKNNGIENYIVLDCRNSELGYIKNNIKLSRLLKLLALDDVDWRKCHEYACKSLVKDACLLWKEGISMKEIAKQLKISTCTVRNYLKKGKIFGLCNYDSSPKKVVQLSVNGDFIREWMGVGEIKRVTGIHSSNIYRSTTEMGKYIVGGFKWMYEEDYQKYISETSCNKKLTNAQ